MKHWFAKLLALRVLSAMPIIVLAIVLSGCAETELDQLERTLADIRQSPVGQPPVIAFELPESHNLAYLYSDGRSPFLPPEPTAQGIANRGGSALAPDQQRTPESLERFPLQELRLVGTMRMGERQVAMIATPDGNVTSVKEGNYMGTAYGRVEHINGQEIRVSERVYTQSEGWQERRVSLVINESNE